MVDVLDARRLQSLFRWLDEKGVIQDVHQEEQHKCHAFTFRVPTLKAKERTAAFFDVLKH